MSEICAALEQFVGTFYLYQANAKIADVRCKGKKLDRKAE